jgi:hypothetical protein
MDKFKHLSYSSISKFLACPAMFRAYMTEKKPLPTAEQIAGRNRHSEIEKHLIANSTDDAPLGKRLKNFCRRVLGPVTGVEENFSIDYLVCDVIGRIDAYSVARNQAVIVDFKGFPGPHIDDLQLKIYALAVQNKHPEVELIHCAFAFVPMDFFEMKTFFQDDLSRISTTLSETIDKISLEREFKATPGPHCSSICGYVNSCPIAKSFDIPEKVDSKSIVKLANEIFAVEALVDKGKAAIKDYMVAHGLDAIPAGADSRYYLSNSSPALRLGKFKAEKEKAANAKIIELEAGTASAKVDPNGGSFSNHDARSLPAAPENVVEFQAQGTSDRVRMSELVEILKKKGRLSQDATNAEGSRAIKELLGVPFISATEQEKRELKARLLT